MAAFTRSVQSTPASSTFQDYLNVRNWRVGSYGALKTLWRYGLVEFPAYCSSDTPVSECTYSCPDLDAVIAGTSTSGRTVEDYVGVLDVLKRGLE